MLTKKQWTPKEFQRVLKQNGFCIVRSKGSHIIWKNENNKTISIPATKVNAMLARRLIKENNLT